MQEKRQPDRVTQIRRREQKSGGRKNASRARRGGWRKEKVER